MVFRAFLFGHLFPQLVHIGAAHVPDIAAGLEYAVEGGIGFHGFSFTGWCWLAESIYSCAAGVKPCHAALMGKYRRPGIFARHHILFSAAGPKLALAGMAYCGYHTR
jgi:hypothetical protein